MKKPFITKCEDCKYRGVTWHEKEIEPCRKCGGELEVLMVGVVKENGR